MTITAPGVACTASAAPPQSGVSSRNSAFELMRIFAMFLIVANHFCFHAGVNYPGLKNIDSQGFINIIATQSLCIGGKLGVFLFGALTGYFLITRTGHLSRLLKLWLVTLFYSLLFFALALWFGTARLNYWELLYNALPLTFARYWFITAYALLFIASPYLSCLLCSLTRRQHLTALIIFGTLWYLIPTVLGTAPLYGPKFYETEYLTLVYAYACGAYLRRYPPTAAALSNLKLILIIALCLSCQLIYLILAERHALPRTNVVFYWLWVTDYTSMFTLLLGVAIFLLFTRLRPFHQPLINSAAALMLGVYLIHDNAYVKPLLWQHLVKLSDHLLQPGYLLWLPCAIVITFISLMAFEYLRALLLDPLFKILLASASRLDRRFCALAPATQPGPATAPSHKSAPVFPTGSSDLAGGGSEGESVSPSAYAQGDGPEGGNLPPSAEGLGPEGGLPSSAKNKGDGPSLNSVKAELNPVEGVGSGVSSPATVAQGDGPEGGKVPPSVKAKEVRS